ncbi:hypothetical protein ACPCG0_10430 [Propionibacteriaceae bacterium Y1923]|uniref:hypothetical protein n=1 Tax=Aestuariimicrobium sp. Y1814 TaxID=3418742 RepID=UPI003C1F4925
MTTRYRQGDKLNDMLVIDNQGLVLTASQLLRIGPIGITVIEACAQPRTLAELRDACVAAFGPAPGGSADDLVGDAVNALLGVGVLAEEHP